MVKKYLLFLMVSLLCVNAFCISKHYNFKNILKKHQTVKSMAKHLSEKTADSDYVVGFFDYICGSKNRKDYDMVLELLDFNIGEYVREVNIECATRIIDTDYTLEKVNIMLENNKFNILTTKELLLEIRNALENKVVLWSDYGKIKKKDDYAKAILWETHNKLEVYKLRFGRYPESLDKIINDFLYLDPKGTNNDPWGNDYYYMLKGDKYILFSKGKDGKELTKDDVYLPFSNYELMNTN